MVYGSFKMESGTFFKLEPLFFGNWNIPMFMICIFYSSLICSFSFFLVPACDEHIPGTSNKKYLFSVTLLPNSGLCFLVVEVSRSCTVRHTHTHTHTPSHPPPSHTHTHTSPASPTHTHTHTQSHTSTPPPSTYTYTAGSTLLNEISDSHRCSYLLNIKKNTRGEHLRPQRDSNPLSSNEAAPDLHLVPHGNRDQQSQIIFSLLSHPKVQ